MNKIFYFSAALLVSAAVAMGTSPITYSKSILESAESSTPYNSSSQKVHFADEEKDDTWIGKGFRVVGNNTELSTIMEHNTMLHKEAKACFFYKSPFYYVMMDNLQNLSFFTKLISLEPASVKLTGLTTTQYVLYNYTLKVTLEEMGKHSKFFPHAHFKVQEYFVAQGKEDPSTLEYLDELNKVYKFYQVTLGLLPTLEKHPIKYIFSIMNSWDKMFRQALANLEALGIMHNRPYTKKNTFEGILKNEMLCLWAPNNRLSSPSRPFFHKSGFFNSFKSASSTRTAYHSLSRGG
ncbi:MAG: hypothetical protein K0M45_03070 [Candidatus Paracaedibacteraceae bacterium]|nr:hypothetical protein [Candidatus Paracaedibacteraceae bacterium]